MQQAARRPGVSAEDIVAVVRIHADRVHDAVRRLGGAPRSAVEVVETSAVDLVQAVAQRPETVADAAGWWFGHAGALAARVAAAAPDLPLGRGVLAADEDQVVLAEALEQLPDRERLALLLRDAYNLPAAVLAAALGAGEAEALRVVGAARLALIPLLDDEPAPPLPTHAPPLPTLSRLGDGGPVAAADATARRHVQACPSCRAVTDAQRRVHLLLTGLAVVALAPSDRAELLDRVEGQAGATLPSATALALTDQELEDADDVDRRVLPPALAALGVTLAVVLGTGIGVVLSRGAAAVLPTPPSVLPAVTLAPVATPTATVPPPVEPEPTPSTRVFFLPRPTLSPSPPPSPTAAPTLPPAPPPRPVVGAATLAVDPVAGPNGQPLRVTGTGWTPGAQVRLDYLGPTGQPTGSSAVATAGADGAFSAQLIARDASMVPGRHEVRATSGAVTTSAFYDARVA